MPKWASDPVSRAAVGPSPQLLVGFFDVSDVSDPVTAGSGTPGSTGSGQPQSLRDHGDQLIELGLGFARAPRGFDAGVAETG
ncbi:MULTISPECIES: hypothetical protein [unclassified Rhodococcus (in: high G+C Gram-positive bacteria)]|uniref:hypothetical protein n=1 Tax=Rhodococcus sp. SJ-3 TaxID=3454628 RepID=UPI003F79447F